MPENTENTYDLWKNGYGASIHLLEEKDEYPVAGYSTLLNQVYNMVRNSNAKKILDAGFGTGILTRKLYDDGYEMYGVDASEQMVEAGQELMPNATLKVGDYSMGFPLSLMKIKYDIIISTYAFHHLDHYEKVLLLRDMLRQLREGGQIIIGDLAFESKEEMKQFRKENKENWLYEDMYLIFRECAKDFPDAKWTKISKCAGIVVITKE